MIESEAKKLFRVYDENYEEQISAMPEELSKYKSRPIDIPDIKYKRPDVTIDRVVDSDGNTTAVNQPIYQNQITNPGNQTNSHNSPRINGLQGIIDRVFETVFGTYDKSDILNPSSLAAPAVLGAIVAQKYGKNLPQKMLITGGVLAGGVAIRKIIVGKKK